MQKIKAAVFDLDGTLLDSMYVWDKVDSDFFEKRGITPPPDYIAETCTMTINEIAVYTKNQFDLPEPPEKLVDEWISMAEAEYKQNVQLKDGAKEFLLYVKEKGLKMGVLTSLSSELAVPALMRCGVYDLFDTVVSTNDSGVAKNREAAYKNVAGLLGVNTQNCIFFDDTHTAVKTAKMAGMVTVGVFEKTSPEIQKTIQETADFYITHWKDAPNF